MRGFLFGALALSLVGGVTPGQAASLPDCEPGVITIWTGQRPGCDLIGNQNRLDVRIPKTWTLGRAIRWADDHGGVLHRGTSYGNDF